MAFHPSTARFPNVGPPGWAHPQAVHFGATADHPMLQPAANVRASSARRPTSRSFGLQTPARYGSGAVNHPPTAPAFSSPFQRSRRHRSNSRDRGFRGRDRHRSPDLRTNPTGPQEANDWASALSNVENAIETLRRNRISQTEAATRTNARVDELAQGLQLQSARVESIATSQEFLLQQTLPTMEATFAPLAVVEQLRAHCQTLEAQMASLMSHLGQLHNPIFTPPTVPDDPMQRRDPWQDQRGRSPEPRGAPHEFGPQQEPQGAQQRENSPPMPNIPTGRATDRVLGFMPDMKTYNAGYLPGAAAPVGPAVPQLRRQLACS